MAKDKGPEPTVFENDTEAIQADMKGRRLYSLKIKGSKRFSVAAKSPDQALAAYARHLGATAERMTEKEQLDIAKSAMRSQEKEKPKEPAA